MITVGIDTSNYTTSIAYYDGKTGQNCSRLLPVKQGELGLRQSDAVFAHIKSLPELAGRLFSHIQQENIRAVGVSTRPRAVEGSYMPCFMVGFSHATLLADALNVPVTTMETAGEGGPYGMALLAAYMLKKAEGETLEEYLNKYVFAGAKGSTLAPEKADVDGFNAYIAAYKNLLKVEKTAVEVI